MIKNKNNGFLKAACLMLAVMMLAVCVISGTLAKYTSTGKVKGGLTVQVAKWSILIGGEEGSDGADLVEKDALTFHDLNVPWTVYDLENVATGLEGNTDNMIAPGTWGYLRIPIVNNSDVTASVKVEVTTSFGLSDSDVESKIEFCVLVRSDSDDEPDSSFDTSEDLNGSTEKSVEHVLAAGNSICLYICFKWPFDLTGTDKDVDDKDKNTAENYGNIEKELTLEGELSITATQAQSTE